MINNKLDSAVNLVHVLIAPALPAGGVAIDATAGNGLDALFLADRVGPAGRVYAFDVQAMALEKTKNLLAAHGAEKQVSLINRGHEDLAQVVTEAVDAVIFNLGYLPGGDHGLITKPDTTITALQSAINLLRPGGRIGLTVYTGHPGARNELAALEDYAKGLSPEVFSVAQTTFLNRSLQAPVVFLVEKAGSTDEGRTARKDS